MNAVENVGGHGQYMTFQLSGQEYGLSIMQVREIIGYRRLTRVPQTPAFILGVINLRGNVVAVLDLALQFGLPPSPITGRTCIIIVEANLTGKPVLTGILADSVSKVLELFPDEILPAPAFGTRVREDFLRGVGRVGETFVLLLDVKKVLLNGGLPTSAAA
jgi:purine-binding chemotaxis protein CheW